MSAISKNTDKNFQLRIKYYFDMMEDIIEQLKCIFETNLVFNATVNNISAIFWSSDLLREETGVPTENHKSPKNLIT